MLAAYHSPADTYSRIEFDARVNGAGQQELVTLLLEELLLALRSAIFAADNGMNQRKSAAMTRAIAALTALEMGVASQSDEGISRTVLHFYRFGKRTILDSVVTFDREAIASLHG